MGVVERAGRIFQKHLEEVFFLRCLGEIEGSIFLESASAKMSS